MRILLIDHGCCDHPHTRIHRLREGLRAEGCRAVACGPTSLHGLDDQPPAMHGIHLYDVAAGSRKLLAAIRDGSSDAFVSAVADVPSRLLGLVRETARQVIAEAADTLFPEAIFVLHAGIFTDLAVETGAPVVVHVGGADLRAAAARPSLRRLVTAVLGSSDGIIAADEATRSALRDSWLAADPEQCGRCDAWSLDAADAPGRIAAACAAALARRRGSV